MSDLVLRRHGGHDRFGQRLPLGEPIKLDATVFPRTTSGDVVVIVGLTAILAPGEPVPDAHDVLTYLGEDYEVEGEPGVWDFLDGQRAGVEISLRRAES